MQSRHSPLITITIPHKMLEGLTAYQEELGLKRSTIVQIALRDWLALQKPIIKKSSSNKRQILDVNGQPFNPANLINYYLPADVSPEEYIHILAEYEAAEKAYYR